MANDLVLNVLIKAKQSVSGEVESAASSLGMLGSVGGVVATGVALAGAALAGIGITATKMAADYEQSMNRVQALTGSSNAQMQQYDAGLKALAQDAGVGPTKLSQGLYYVISAGYQGADAMKMLTLATKDAVIDMSDSTTTANALTTVMQGFGFSVKQADAVNGEMLRTVTLGKMSMSDYAGAVSKSASVAVQYHDNLENLNSVLATLTSSGVKSAAIASTDYNNLLKVLVGNVDSVAKKAHSLNSAFDVNAFKAMNVHDKIMYLNEMIVQHGHNITEVFGKQQNAAQGFTLLATHAGMYANDLKALSNQQANANATTIAWNTTQSGFNQTMNRLKATIGVVLINIGQQLLPIFTQAARDIIPIVAQIGNWIVKSGMLSVVTNGLVGGIKLLIGILSTIIGIGAGFIGFLQHGGAAAGIVKVILMGLAGAALGFVASAIPPLITSFIAWATAAGAAALATLAATWPFILAGAIIAMVVGGIILAIKNWGKIVDWLKGVWRGFQQFLINLWHGIQTFLKGALLVVVGIILGPFLLIGGLFVWLYNHNKYFKMLADAIISIISNVVGWLKGIWQDAVNFVAGVWNNLVGKARQLWNNVTGVFKGAWGAISGALGGLWNNLTGWFGNLANQAIQWGKNLIGGFINGVKGMFGAVGNAISGVAGWIGNFLGFHSPAKMGPGSEADKWAPNFMNMYIQGFRNNIPALRQVMQEVSQELTAADKHHHTGHHHTSHRGHYTGHHHTSHRGHHTGHHHTSHHGAFNPVDVSNAMSNGGGLAGSGGLGSGASGSGVTVINNITINAPNTSAQDIVKLVLKEINFQNKRRGNFVTATSGGRV